MDMSFTFIDLMVVGIVVVSTIFAVYRGFVAETLSIFAWAAAAFATLYFGPAVAPLTRGLFGAAWIGMLVAYAFVFLVVLIPLSFVSFRMSEGVKKSPVGALDRALGFFFGVLRGLAIVGIAYLVFSMMVAIRDQPYWIQDARLLPLIQGSSEVLLTLVPDQKTTVARSEKPARSAPVPKAKPGGDTAEKDKKKHAGKTYGAGDRRALDRLIEATGDGGHK